MKILIIGNGYIGNRCLSAWQNKAEVVMADGLIRTVDDVCQLLVKHQPQAVLNAAGIIGRPNVDWCEDHQTETFFGNTVLPLLIATACQQVKVYLLHIGSGCIFYGTSPEPAGWREDDFANPAAVYTKAKYAADLMLQAMPLVGIARIRMPIDHIAYRGNLLDKLAAYPKLIDVENSLTVMDDMVDVFYQLLAKQAVGIFHVTNPGTIKHREIMAWYEEYVDPSHKNEWISESELLTLGLVNKKRSNNILQSTNLARLGITMRPVKEAVLDTIKKYKR